MELVMVWMRATYQPNERQASEMERPALRAWPLPAAASVDEHASLRERVARTERARESPIREEAGLLQMRAGTGGLGRGRHM